jgi:predicted SnoaL-like aldol condensation-catalyzing enzyme
MRRLAVSEQNKRVLRRFFREVWSEGNLALVDELFARDWMGHAPLGELSEPAALKQLVAAQRRTFPDLRITVEAQIAEGDMVATRWTAHRTRQVTAETSQSEMSSGMTLARLACGKIVEDWTSWDAHIFKETVR